MQDVIQPSGHMDKLGDIVVVKFKILLPEKVFDIAQRSGKQIIHRHHLVAFRHKPVTQMRPKESSGSGDQNSLQCRYFSLVTASKGNK
jgi:hypothetical protein